MHLETASKHLANRLKRLLRWLIVSLCCLQPLQANNEVTYWQYFMINYLGTNIDPITHTVQAPFLPASPSLNTQTFDSLASSYQTLKQAATSDTQNILNQWLKNNLDRSSYFSGTLNNITPNITPPASSPFGATPTPTPNDSSLNLDALLSQDSISGLQHTTPSAESGNAAINFILLASNALDPLNFEQSRGDRSQQDWYRYLATSWGITAKMSIVLSNLFYTLRQREIIPGLGALAGLPQNDASPRQVEAYMAQRRLSQTWLNQIEQSPPIVIQREGLHVLAEMQRLMHLSKEQDERILITLSAILTQGLEMAKEMVKLQKQIDAAQEEANSAASDFSNLEI